MEETARLLAFGDICLHNFSEEQFYESQGYATLVRELNSFDGIAFANLECPFTASDTLNLNKIAIRGNPNLIQHLPRIDMVSIANNHISDAGHPGAIETIRLLSNRGIRFVGYGDDLCDARRASIVCKDGITFGFLAYSCLTTNGENYATQIKEGVPPLALQYIKDDVRYIKSKVDHVILAFHWGEEDAHYPTPDQIMLAHESVDAGVSVIIGSHPHVIQGIECYQKGIICYSLGNFIFSDVTYQAKRGRKVLNRTAPLSQANRESVSVEFAFTRDKVTLTRVAAYKLDRQNLPNKVGLNTLSKNLSELNKRITKYVKNKSRYINSLPDLLLCIQFDSAKYQNRYQLKPINENHKIIKGRLFSRRVVSKLLSLFRSY